MKLDESTLTAYLVKHLHPLTSADPAILAKYIIVLLRKDKSSKELQELCCQSLVDFLGHSTKPFVTNLFQAIEDGAPLRSLVNADLTMAFEPASLGLDREELQVLPSKGEEYLTSRKEHGHASSSGSTSDSEDRELSDDEDDDRNHKHRKRDSRPESFGDDNQGALLRRTTKKPNRTDVNGDLFNAGRLSDGKNGSNDLFDRGPLMKIDKHSSGMASFSRPPVDLGQRGRINHSRNGSSSHTDIPSSFSRSFAGRGRGRGAGNWSQHDSRFIPHGTLDFPSHITPRGPSLPGLFVGTGMPSAAGAQNASWGSFGFLPGIPNGCMDPLHSLGMPGALHSTIGPQMNLSVPRQRCRDFEEQGFCLRGDMCPMEHGVNRIVVEDVQSLSQFNLPVSLPNSHKGGFQATSGSLPSVGAFSGLPRNKAPSGKVNKSFITDDGLGGNEVLPSVPAGDNDVYDPDKPLWNNNNINLPHGQLGDPVADEPETFQDGDPSPLNDFKLSYKGDNSPLPDSNPDDSNSHGRGRFGSGSRLKMTRRDENSVIESRFPDNDATCVHDVTLDTHISTEGELRSSAEAIQKACTSTPVPKYRKDPRRNAKRVSQRASCTLFVSCIPVKNNRRDALFSHFQKFGTVVDIHIPLNGEKAFVQFSKREEAEAALESPEAVMGNRFIRLSWANRDNIANNNYGVDGANSLAGYVSVSLKPSVPTGNGSLSFVPKVGIAGTESMALAARTVGVSVGDPAPVSSVQPKAQVLSAPKVAPPVQKKRENLELLKEEMRRKQELLEQKRIEFKNQLEKLEKQSASAKKSGAASEKLIKKQKVEKYCEVHKPASSNSSNHDASGEPTTTADLNSSRDALSPGSKKNLSFDSHVTTSPLESGKPNVSSMYRSGFNNQSHGFRIVPPLPTGFANLAVIEDHFSHFEDLVSVDLETGHTGESSKLSANLSARVIFSTLDSAQRAFSDANYWQGIKLKFAWLRTDSPSNNPVSEHASSLPHVKSVANSCSEHLTTGHFLSNSNVSTDSVIREVVYATENHENVDLDIENSSVDSTIKANSYARLQSSKQCNLAIPNEDSIDPNFLK